MGRLIPVILILSFFVLPLQSVFAEWEDLKTEKVPGTAGSSVEYVTKSGTKFYTLWRSGSSNDDKAYYSTLGGSSASAMTSIDALYFNNIEDYDESANYLYVLGSDSEGEYPRVFSIQKGGTGATKISNRSVSYWIDALGVDNNGVLWMSTGEGGYYHSHIDFKTYNHSTSTWTIQNIGFPYTDDYTVRDMLFTSNNYLLANIAYNSTYTTWVYKDGTWTRVPFIDSNTSTYLMYRSKSKIYARRTSDNRLYVLNETTWKWDRFNIDTTILAGPEYLFFNKYEDYIYALDTERTGVVKIAPDGTQTYYGSSGASAIQYAFGDPVTGYVYAFSTNGATAAPERVYKLNLTEQSIAGVADAAKEASDAATSVNNTMNTIISPQLSLVEGAVRDGSGNTSLSLSQAAKTSADTAVTKLAKLESMINLKFDSLEGYNGATVTTTTTFKLAIGHQGANQYRLKLDSGAWTSWTSLATHDTNGYVTLSPSIGAHTVLVEVRNNDGVNITPPLVKSFSFFRLS